MASFHLHSLLLFTLLLLQSSLSLSSSAIVLPLTKDPQTNQHLTRIFHTSQLLPTNLVLDLNSPFLWLGISSNTNSPILRRSIQCSASGLDQSGPSDEVCKFPLKNPVTGDIASGELVQDVISVNNQISAVDQILLHGSAPSILLTGLAGSAKGVFGLGRNRVGVVEQVSHFSGLSKKFSLCLSSTNGMILFGENQPNKVLNSMVYTPILRGNNNNGVDIDSYNINLKSLKIQHKKLPFDDFSTIRITTIAPYTLMESKLYGEFVIGFAAAAEALNMVREHPVGRFELCYKANGSGKVPLIDLVLQSEMVKWRIHGHNSMVKVNDEVACLGILDGGVDLGASIVLGSYQLEDNLLEFDFGSSMLGFSSSLIGKGTSCSNLSLASLHKDVQSS